MAYNDGEALIATLLETATGFTSANITRGKWGILNSGNSDHYAILRRGGWTQALDTQAVYRVTYRSIIEVWQRLTDDGTSAISLYTHVENVRNHLSPYKLLGGSGILDANVVGGGETKEMWTTKGDAPSWLKEEIWLDWSEQDTVTYV
jgi:hypothetical protein